MDPFNIPEFKLPKIPTYEPVKSAPELAYEALVRTMNRFQKGLSQDEELGILANGAGLILHVESVGFSGQMMTFDGVDSEKRRSRLIQHFTQVNVQMIAVPKLGEEARRIGFHSP